VHTTDDEAADHWAETVPGVEVLRFDKENFWEMGETGPCGPCSEIHVDLGAGACPKRRRKGHTCEVNGDCGRYVELWNLVFIQFERDGEGKTTDLPAKHVDTGLGLERLVAVLQGKTSNYETDLFRPLIDRVGDLTETPYDKGPEGMAHRVLADHTRALTFAIADGASPSNEGRGYVVRRILRRASRFARNLGVHEPVLWQLVSRVVEDLGPVFPQVRDALAQVEMLVRSEEERFGETLDQGIRIFEELLEALEEKGGKEIPGGSAFTLYDTYGFPLDLTELMAREKGYTVDVKGFEAEMERQKKRSREAAGGEGGRVPDLASLEIVKGTGGTRFLGYESTRTRSKVLGSGEVEHEGGEAVALILEATPFYAESGGQVGDTGLIRGDDFTFRVLDTRKAEGRIVHIGRYEEGVVKGRGAEVEATVDEDRRQRITRNHSGTHIMHWALRETLGDHVRQQGSLVAPDRLRFDFSHPRKVSMDEIFEIERLVNEKIRRNEGRETCEMAYKEAMKQGILAFFGEKYGDEVRVVDIGGFSRELCGGTHVGHTGEIGLFLLPHESSIASGIRRVEGVTGREAVAHVIGNRQVLAEIGGLLKAAPDQLARRIGALMEEIKALRKRPAAAALDAGAESRRLLGAAEDISGVKIVTADLPDVPLSDLRRVADSIRANPEPTAGVLATASEGKVHLLAFVTEPLAKEKKLNAGALIKEIAPVVGGGGGGRPEFAQAGGRDASKIPEALRKAAEILRKELGTGTHS
jgi:alanyl-tRNA synthetase